MSFFFPEAGGDIHPAYDDLGHPKGCECEEDGGWQSCEDCYLTITCPARNHDYIDDSEVVAAKR